MENLDEIYNKSRFSHLFERNNEFQLMHSIIMRPLVLDNESIKIFNQFRYGANPQEIIKKIPESEGLVKHLISEKMIHSKSLDETKLLREWVKEKANPEGLLIAYILPTDECNFRCKYCFIENNMPQNQKFRYMSEDTAIKGVDFFANNLSKEKGITPEVIFYGGEPLLNPNIVLKTINYLRKNYSYIDINIVTNGSKITKEIADNFTKNNVGVSISLDGPEIINNKMRLSGLNKGTYNSAVQGYNLLKESGCENLGISFTLGNHNIHNLKNNVEKICNDLNPKSFGFNFMLGSYKEGNPYSLPMKYTTEMTIETFKFLREKGIYEDRIMRKLKPFIKGSLHIKDCGAPGNQIVIAPNGDMGPCQGFLSSGKYFTMNVHNSPILEDDVSFNYWKNRFAINIDSCLDCRALGICGGGCAYNAYLNHGDIWSMDDRLCEHNKIFIDWVLWDLYDSKKEKSKTP